MQPRNSSKARLSALLLLTALFATASTGAVLWTGCSRSSSKSTKSHGSPEALARRDARDLANAQELTRSFFKAVKEDDCRLIVDNLTTGATMADCEEFVREWKGHSLQLVEILDAKRDGRNRKAIIVRARVKGRKGEKITLVRVVRAKGRWAVKL